ncbi:NAD(P)-dependent alcohol dehydrogenase [Kiloniella sp. b19]|uniref:NAD(P)-dependent alcohol dehydrogenase n=1 Tax=Kiloniella sp. GXU_MW_B19 TaxID=3141326 RepID=UPI0031E01DF0
MQPTKSYAAYNDRDDLKPYQFNRREVGPKDVQIDILFCGVCHSDIHVVRNDWGFSSYPLVPGHEIVGRVRALGCDVTSLSIGELVGVGCMVDSCRECSACKEDLEQHCEKGMLMTYGSPDPHEADRITQGGYSTRIVVDRDFVVKVPESLDVKAVAPLLCAGITTYSPLRQWKVKPGDRVGVIGLGGLGHMGVKLAVAMGADVIMITSSAEKGEDARRLGASDVLVSTDEDAMARHANSFDLLLDTIPVAHRMDPYVRLLKFGKAMVVVGITPAEINTGVLSFGRRIITGSLIGGIRETQEMLDFCAEHNVVSDVELIAMQDINTAYERMMRADVKYRFVIDMQSLKED